MTQTRLVDNATVRQSVWAFAAQPELRTSIEVLRNCMFGELLFDITSSTMPATGGHPFPKGSELRIYGGTGPDGGRALFAFTRQEEIDRRYPAGSTTQSLVTPAAGALSLARHQGDSWLYIDPAGPTCALSAQEMDFALRNPNNEPLKNILSIMAMGRCDRADVLRMLRTEGPLLVGADESIPGSARMRGVHHPDGSVSLCGFTSAPEVLAFTPSDAVAVFTTSQMVSMVRERGYRGLIINPAGPSAAFLVEELFS